jgi:hypothetical protein
MRYLLTFIMFITAAAAGDTAGTIKTLLAEKKYKAANILLKDALKGKPGSVSINAQLGYTEEKLGNLSMAKKYYATAALLNLQNGEDAGDAEAAITRLVKLEPAVGPIFSHGTALLLEADKLKGASKKLVQDAATQLLKTGLAVEHMPGTKPAPVPVQFTEAEIEKNLGYNLGWATASAVKGPNGHRYKFFVERVSWDEAQERCKKAGGYLATPSSAEEAAFIQSMLGERREAAAIGIVKVEDSWIGVTKETVTVKWLEPATLKDPRYTKTALYGSKSHGAAVVYDGIKGPLLNGYICEWVK